MERLEREMIMYENALLREVKMDYKFKTEPYAHQLHALAASHKKGKLCSIYGDGYR